MSKLKTHQSGQSNVRPCLRSGGLASWRQQRPEYKQVLTWLADPATFDAKQCPILLGGDEAQRKLLMSMEMQTILAQGLQQACKSREFALFVDSCAAQQGQEPRQASPRERIATEIANNNKLDTVTLPTPR